MSIIAQAKANLLQTIKSLEERRDSLNSAIDSLKAAVSKIDELSLDDLPGSPSVPESIDTNRNGVRPGIIAVENFDPVFPNQISRLAQTAFREGTQFNRIANVFISNGNVHVTVAKLAEAINASRSATTNILYRTQKEAFDSQRVPGHVRLKAWKLKPDLFAKILELAAGNEEENEQ